MSSPVKNAGTGKHLYKAAPAAWGRAQPAENRKDGISFPGRNSAAAPATWKQAELVVESNKKELTVILSELDALVTRKTSPSTASSESNSSSIQQDVSRLLTRLGKFQFPRNYLLLVKEVQAVCLRLLDLPGDCLSALDYASISR